MSTTTVVAANLTAGTLIRIPFSLPKVGPNHTVAAGRHATVLGQRVDNFPNVALTVQIGKAMRTFLIPATYAIEVI